MKLGSLFDGSGTAPLCAAILGWEPVWASEIEPFPIKVTSKRFPRMKHLGDITKINGGEIEPVDVIVGGSPCQDLSVAGKQAGLQGGTRSHLFYEMTRIIKEMRRATNGKYPRYIVWENVPGAFSSNQGRDFHEVLKAFVSCADHPCDVPDPPRKGRAGADKLVWGNAGLVVGDGFSLGWRVLDAQYWGVPQRRRRIFLAVDLGGERAGEILFEREGLRRDLEQSRKARKSTAAAAVGSTDRGVGIRCLNEGDSQTIRQYDVDGVYPALVANATGGQNRQGICYAVEGYTVDRNSAQNGRGYCEDVSPTLDAQDRHAVATIDCRNGVLNADVSGTLQANPASLNAINPVVYTGVGITSKENGSNPQPGDPCCTLDTDSRKYLVTPLLETMQGFSDYKETGVASGLKARDYKDATDLVLCNGKPPRRYIVRRLTPMECCRLQGFPDWWAYGCEKQPITGWWLENNGWMRVIDPHGEIDGSDSAIYKMWGNGMALPCMLFVLSGIREEEIQ